jgi:hypothetical protein
MDNKKFKTEQKNKLLFSIMCENNPNIENITLEFFLNQSILIFALFVTISTLFTLSLIIHKIT